MLRSRVLLAVTSMLTLAAVVAAVAGAATIIVGKATVKGKMHAAIVTGNARRAGSITVTGTSTPSEKVTVDWSINCPTSQQGNTKSGFGKFTTTTPFKRVLVKTLPGTPPCITSAYVYGTKNATLTGEVTQP